jgi:hypothetical protein
MIALIEPACILILCWFDFTDTTRITVALVLERSTLYITQ